MQYFSTVRDLLLVIIGFGLIVFIHELGHFLAARWAGIRVLAFAIGFGPAVASYRKGMGVRLGSSEKEYVGILDAAAAGTTTIEGRRATYHNISPTEYRFNLLPLGGYVKMLGQEDANPNATSDAPDSYQNCRPWRRMVVISAGVIMNIITAAVLFIAVYMIGLPVEPAQVGSVAPGLPAASAIATNAERLGIVEPGLQPGDEIIDINGNRPNSFSDLILATAMTGPNESISLLVRRPGVDAPLVFKIVPETSKLTNLLELGIGPARSTRLLKARTPSDAAEFEASLAGLGYMGIKPGMELVRVGDRQPVRSGHALDQAANDSNGHPFQAEFVGEDGSHATITIDPRPALETDFLFRSDKVITPVDHLLGLTPVMRVAKAGDAAKKGLQDGDIFARIGDVEYPSLAQGLAEVKASRGRTIPVVVLRGKEVAQKLVSLDIKVDSKGIIGFLAGDVADTQALVALPPAALRRLGESEPFEPPAASVIISPGTRITAVNDRPVTDFATLRHALLDVTHAATGDASITLRVQRPLDGIASVDVPVESVKWDLSKADISRLRALGWDNPLQLQFDAESVIRKASTPREAIEIGLSETRRVMLNTYLTFARLAQGTVKVEHLKGPVGIAHLGTLVASKGFTNLLFFMALISVNLAVINFLPLPIVDGGQFLFLLYEQFRGRPVPIGFQNAVTMVGLVLIASMFLIVTFNDITSLLGF